jgi:hypothetical protein
VWNIVKGVGKRFEHHNPKKNCLMPQMAPTGSKPHFSKLEPDNKIALQAYSSNIFHSESIEIDEK